jgi:protoporphyrin/coproporphyrin ferrochelatase
MTTNSREAGEQGGRYGVLLLNMGGPHDLDCVEDYIYQLLADPDMVRLGWASFLREPLARFISRKRGPKVRKRYAMMGGKSPINEATAEQAALLQRQIGMPVAYAMRYTPPPVSSALDELRGAGCERVVVVMLYPQYSTVSTLSSLKDFNRQNTRSIPHRIVDRHFSDPTYIGGMQSLLREGLGGLKPHVRTHLLFVAHSIPEAYVREGDPYTDEVERTAELIRAGVPEAPPHSLAYQSQVGPVKWRGPYLEEALRTMLDQGVQQLVVQPLSFVSECLETIFDLDIDFKEMCAKAGITAYIRIPAPSSASWYIDALEGLSRGAINDWEAERA